jgi:Do/DeqQ family serine protease
MLEFLKKQRNLVAGFCGGAAASILVVSGLQLFRPERSTVATGQLPVNYARFGGTGGEIPVFTKAASVATPAVVHIKTSVSEKSSRTRGQDPSQDLFRDFFGERFDFRMPQPGGGSGSGVILTQDGYIVTNNHVIDNADKVEVTLNNNKTYEARVIGTDPSTDLAVLKIEETGLPMLKYGDSDALQIGEWVLAVGNPFNLTSTVTAGIVSAKGRSLNLLNDKFRIESFIQTDAAVNPGNSGGALINESAELVGVNTAIASQTGSYAGYSFAVPSRIVRKVVDDLINYGSVQRGFLGVMIQDVNAELAKKEKLNVSQGVFISEVNEGSAAQESGLEKGDVIQKIDNISVNSASELQEQIGRHRPGDKVNVTVIRKNQPKTIVVTLKNKSGNTEIVKAASADLNAKLGASFQPLTNMEMQELKVKHGLRVSDVRAGRFRTAGIEPGFVITHVDKQPIRTEADLTRAFEGKEGAVLVEGLYEAGGRDAYAVMVR